MKIAITGITQNDNHVRGTARVEYEYFTIPALLCDVSVSVEYVEGKTLEQYTSELKIVALKIIRTMHDELVRDGNLDDVMGWSFRMSNECGKLVVRDEKGETKPTSQHRDEIIERVISDLMCGNGNMLQRLGRSMGILQLAAEIEAIAQMREPIHREAILRDFDNPPPFKVVPDGWISPGLEYLKGRL